MAAPLPPIDTLLEVRTGKIRPLGTAGIRSAIAKTPRTGALFASKTGLPGDQQAYEHHGGFEKALHHYSATNYAAWCLEKPDRAHLFVIGGYGENLVSEGLNETNVCVGDVFRIGQNVRVKVTMPRLPCYKLNHRFEWNKASIRTQQTGRTGWYYSVEKMGPIRAGDKMMLLDRPYPEWSVKRVVDVMFNDKQSELFPVLDAIEGMGTQIRELIQDWMARGHENDSEKARLGFVGLDWGDYKLVEKTPLTTSITSFVFEVVEEGSLGDEIEFGQFAYIRLRFGPGGSLVRAYSIVRGDKRKFELGIALDKKSRGGSQFLHNSLQVGDQVSAVDGVLPKKVNTDDTPVQDYVFIVGGIGITAFVREISEVRSRGKSIRVHYACSSRANVAYRETLPEDATTYYAKDEGSRLDVNEIIPTTYGSDTHKNTMVLCCGPPSLMEACRQRLEDIKHPENFQHFESFGETSGGGEPFEVEVAGSGKVLQVPGDKSLLQVLNEAGFDTPSSCLAGNCGMCMIDYTTGNVEHRGIALSSEQKCTSLLSCVSRGEGKITIDV